jgi:hypothetical protein
MSGIVGDNTARASGVIASAGGGGKCLQVLEYSTTGTVSRNSTSWGQIGSFEQAITPTGESSKMILTFSAGLVDCQNQGHLRFYYDVDGGGYNVCDPVGAAAGSRIDSHIFEDTDRNCISGTILHTPSYSLGNVLTYQVWSKVTSSTYPLYLGRTFADGNSSDHGRTQSILRVEEIGA